MSFKQFAVGHRLAYEGNVPQRFLWFIRGFEMLERLYRVLLSNGRNAWEFGVTKLKKVTAPVA